MKPGPVALQFLRQQITPEWAIPLLPRIPHVTIDEVIRENAREKPITDGERTAWNLLNLCRMARRQGKNLKEILYKITLSADGTFVSPSRRKAFAQKWLARMKKRNHERRGR